MQLLRRGDSGPAVVEIRAMLTTFGLLAAGANGGGEVVDRFDSHVEHAVRSFQQQRGLITDGVAAGRLSVASPRLASYAILDLGMGVANWYRADGEHSENEVAWQHTEFALRMVAARDTAGDPS